MKRGLLSLACLGSLVMSSPPPLADNVTGAHDLLCTSVQATVCDADDCEIGPPWSWDIPQFIEIDLDDKLLRSTEASGENRETPIKNMQRTDGTLFLQGIQRGRAFSFVIDEASGMASIAIAMDGRTISVFGACTPRNADARR